MDCNFPFLIRRYSTFRNDLPSLVWQRYFTKTSSAPVVIRSRSKCPMKSICVSQHRALKVLLLMWSSPAALVKVKLSASRLSTGPQPFFSQAAYHFRTTSSFVKFCPPNGLALSQSGGNGLAPSIEDYRQPFPESRVKMRHFLRQIVQLAATPHILGPNGYTLRSADQSVDRVLDAL